ncbi:MAG TPA: dUTP diphosphatase [Nitrospinae bacterium]|nr:dUTP diphosphatase [Nitrospinota bacterium]
MSSLSCRVSGESIPQYAHAGDAGADITASEKIAIPPRERALVSTGVRLEIPEGCVGLIWPRSGLAVKKGIDCGAGVIDSHYRGEVKILLFNHSDTEFQVEPGDRIAQILIQKVKRVEFLSADQLNETARKDAGFGSTGK